MGTRLPYRWRPQRDPKDPRKTGKWSDTVESRPLRVQLLVDKGVPWLCDEETVGYLCHVRVLRDYVRCLEAMGLPVSLK